MSLIIHLYETGHPAQSNVTVALPQMFLLCFRKNYWDSDINVINVNTYFYLVFVGIIYLIFNCWLRSFYSEVAVFVSCLRILNCKLYINLNISTKIANGSIEKYFSWYWVCSRVFCLIWQIEESCISNRSLFHIAKELAIPKTETGIGVVPKLYDFFNA